MNKQDLIQIIKEDHQLMMDLAHIVIIQTNVTDFTGTAKLASDLAECHQYSINHLQK